MLISGIGLGIVLSVVFDDLDKKILHEICTGIYSYDDLAKKLNVTRSTIYRRIEKLEQSHAIDRKIMAIPNFNVLNLSAIIVGLSAAYDDAEKVFENIQTLPHVKFLWRCYGEVQAVALLICERGNEGATIASLYKALAKLETGSYHITVGFKWERMDFSPF
ncbi:MAG TPA: Lrp/AsnC family transcriptional regulator [Candidatus Bathyarchaeia archaeon]|nr:Lrp/AsnC family transcriptional regulator [Candidatus Bathyarchaeia archaeon]